MGLNAAGGGQWGAKSGQTGGGAGDLYERRRRRNSNRWEEEMTLDFKLWSNFLNANNIVHSPLCVS